MAPSKRRWPWLLVAVLLLGAAAWLMSGAEPPEPERARVSLPRRMSHDERERNDARQTWLPLVHLDDAGLPLAPTERPKDPVLAAFPKEVKYAAVVVEANAIRNSDIGDLLIDCMFGGRPEVMSSFRDAGFDPLTAIDRVSMADRTLLVSGAFGSADVKGMLHADTSQQWGRRSTLYTATTPDGRSRVSGVWNNQMLVVGRDEAEVKATLDRLEGVGPATTGKPLVPQEEAYGEVYGTLTGAGLAAMVSEENPALAEVITAAAGTVRVHADVSHDVGLVADIVGTDTQKTEDLRKALGSALTLARLQAKAEGRTDEVAILDMAKVGSAEEGSQFRLEAGLPFTFLEKNLKECARERREEQAQRERGPEVDAGRP